MSWEADIVFKFILYFKVLFLGFENDPNLKYLAYAGPVIFDEKIVKPIFGLIVYNLYYYGSGKTVKYI